MFGSGRSRHGNDSFSKHRVEKTAGSKSRRSFKGSSFTNRPANLDLTSSKQHQAPSRVPTQSQLNSATITLSVGSHPSRLFAAHTDVLKTSPFFESALRSQYYNSSSRQLLLQDEVPEIFACLLEFMYKGDYTPKLEYDSRRAAFSLENHATSPGTIDVTVWIPSTSSNRSSVPISPTCLQPHPTNPAAGQGVFVLRDTAIYCAAERYSLPQLKKIALRKQGLQAGIPVSTILASARYAYAFTPDNDRHLRAHYLALIIRSRHTFKRSGTMQVEMGMASPRLGVEGSGTNLWFDLFVAMCNHLDDLEDMNNTNKIARS